VIDDPDALPALLTRLLGPRVSWSATEQVRAASLTAVAEAVQQAAPAPVPSSGEGAAVEYDVTDAGVVARIGRHPVGAATLAPAGSSEQREGSVEVAPAWRRLGIGRELLNRLSRLAVATGAEELVLLAPASDDGVVPLLAACGLRGRIRLSDAGLSVHVNLSGVRPLGETAGLAR
jgi:GNAT superfamily N-acetyltransferase